MRALWRVETTARRDGSSDAYRHRDILVRIREYLKVFVHIFAVTNGCV